MKTHNRITYHCLHCGSVVHAELEVKPPNCCGEEMREAAGETVCESEPEESIVADREADSRRTR